MMNVPYMEVWCISERDDVPNMIKVGNPYLIDRSSIWIDSDGDAFGDVYEQTGRRIGQMLLSHFSSF